MSETPLDRDDSFSKDCGSLKDLPKQLKFVFPDLTQLLSLLSADDMDQLICSFLKIPSDSTPEAIQRAFCRRIGISESTTNKDFREQIEAIVKNAFRKQMDQN